MPLVYAKSATGWWCWEAGTKGTKRAAAAAPFPDWITNDCVITGKNQQEIRLREYFHDNCQTFGNKYYEQQSAIYYLVVKHQDYEVVEEFTNQSNIQIYIGSASKGVKKRWSEHCYVAKKVLELKYSQNTIEENKHQLVDNFLALARLRDFQMALFVVKCCDKETDMRPAERECIDQHRRSIKHSLNVIQGKSS